MDKKPRILVLSHFFYPHVGGVEDHVLEISQRLNQMGFELDILTKRHQLELPAQDTYQDSKIRRIAFPEIKFLGLIILWLKLFWFLLVEGHIWQYDLIQIHDVFIWYLPFRILFPFKKVVLTMHGWEGQWPIPQKNIWLRRLSAKLSNYVICVGQYIEDYYQVEADLLTYGGIDDHDWVSQEKLIDKHTAGRGQEVKILYLGRLAPDTGLQLFLRSLASLEQEDVEFQVKFAGQGKLAEECRVRGELLGWTTGEDLERLLQESQICFASGYLSALKSLAGGCLTVTACETQLKQDYWLNSPFADRIFCADDSLQLEKFLAEYITQPSRFLSRVQRGHSWSRHQSWDKLAGDYQQIYLGLLN